MKKKIIISNGAGGCGKDTFYKILKSHGDFKTCKYSSIDYVKFIAKTYLGWDGIKDEKGRKFLSDIKCACTKYNDLPFDKISEFLDTFFSSDYDIAVVDIREPREIKKIVDRYGKNNVITVLITREDIDIITSNMADAGVNNYNYDFVIKNNDTIESYENKIDEFIENIL